jgi:hypothetical protein
MMRTAVYTTPFLLMTIWGCPESGDGQTPDASSMNSAIIEIDGLAPDLVCPGATGCETANGSLYVGAAKRSITPILESFEDTDGNGIQNGEETYVDANQNQVWDGTWMAGFSMGRAATAVHDDIWARALSLRKGDVRIGLVALDLIGFWHKDAIAVRVAAKEAGLDFDHIMIASTHQHEGPDTMGLWGPDPSTSGYDSAYLAEVISKAVDALREAQETEVASHLDYARTEAQHLVNDTRLPEVMDPSIHALRFIDESEETIATMAIWGNHPEALGSDNTELTSDYPHYLRQALEEKYPGSTAVFFSGLLGGLMTTIGIIGCPDLNGEETCPQGTFERADYIGTSVGQSIIAALEAEDRISSTDPDLSMRRLSLLAPLSNDVFVFGFKIGLLERDGYLLEDNTQIPSDKLAEESMESILANFGLGTEVSSIIIGPLEIAAIPGELYPELFLEKEGGGSYIEFPENADFMGAEAETPIQSYMNAALQRATVNNANDSLGYIIPKPQFDYKAPYAYEPDGQYGEQNSTGEDIAAAISAAFDRMYSLVP